MINPAVLTTGYIRVAYILAPEDAPDLVRYGVLMHIAVDGNDCVISPCVDSNGEYILYNGVIFSTTADDVAPAFGDDFIRQIYMDSQYLFNQGNPVTVAPPVSVPVWVGDYSQA